MKIVVAVAFAVAMSFATAASSVWLKPESERIAFNQFELQREFAFHRALFSSYSLELFHSSFSQLWERTALLLDNGFLPKGTNAGNNFNPHEPKSVFEEVFHHAPPIAYVYPSETYYYFYFTRGELTVAGNFRFVDAAEGKLHIGYYDKDDPHSSYMGAATFTKEDGVEVQLVDPYQVSVTYQGVTKLFRTNSRIHEAPVDTELQDDEKFIARILDESGFEFFLVFNETTDSFYYLLSSEALLPEDLVAGPKSYSLAPKSAFVFYTDHEYDRTLLVGVHEKNIYFNNYFDGPFDQLPPRLQIREMLHRAYPYTLERGGIDEHGNFNEIDGTRVAISPYTNYRTLSSLLEYQSRCFNRTKNRSELWSCLSYEWKHDFHRSPNAPYGDGLYRHHKIFVSQGWPANHLGEVSRNWPKLHKSEQSSGWKANSYGFTEQGAE